MLELLLDLDGDELYDQLVTYEADTGSSHLWDGEDEFDFLVVPSSIEDGVYRVSVPLVELQPSGPIHILANRINDQGEDGSEPCSEEPLVVE